jgi:DNA excision repair protein ERCC-4
MGSVKILVDTREAAAGVGEHLVTLGADIEWCLLPTADYLVAEGVGVERKTLPDFCRSMRTGRLWRQLTALQDVFERAYLLLEGARVTNGVITAAGIRGALLEVIDQGLVVIWSSSPTDSAGWLFRIAERAQRSRVPTRRSLRRGYKRPATPAGVLAAVPGVSPAIGARLVDRFGSVARVASASSEELRMVPGIGARRAAAIQRVLSGRFSAERESASAESTARPRTPSS